MEIIIIKEEYDKDVPNESFPRIDIVSILELKPDYLDLEGFYLSSTDVKKINEYFLGKKANYDLTIGDIVCYRKFSILGCFIAGADESLYRNKVKKVNRIEVNRFELMDI